MPMTEFEVRDLTEFAHRKLRNGGATSLEDCLREWRESRLCVEDAASIRQGLAEANAGLLRDFDDVDADLRKKYSLGEPRYPVPLNPLRSVYPKPPVSSSRRQTSLTAFGPILAELTPAHADTDSGRAAC